MKVEIADFSCPGTMTACNSWPGVMIQRTFLDILEASVNAGFILVTAAWYRKYEHASRMGVWAACVGLSKIIGGAIAYGCVAGYEKHPKANFSSWKILALVTGLVSIVYGICMLLSMAGSVVTARWQNQKDRVLAVERLRGNHQGVGTTHYKRYRAKETWLDYRTWWYVFFVLSSQIPAAGLMLFNSILVKSHGFDTKTTLLLAMPDGLVNILANWGLWGCCGQSPETTVGMHSSQLGLHLWRRSLRRAGLGGAALRALRSTRRLLSLVGHQRNSMVPRHIAYERQRAWPHQEDFKQWHSLYGARAGVLCWSTVIH